MSRYIKNIQINNTLKPETRKGKQRLSNKKKRIYESILTSPQKIKEIIKKRKQSLKNINNYEKLSLRDKQLKILEQLKLSDITQPITNDSIINNVSPKDTLNTINDINDINDIIKEEKEYYSKETEIKETSESINKDSIKKENNKVKNPFDIVNDNFYYNDEVPKVKVKKLNFETKFKVSPKNYKRRSNPRKTKRAPQKYKSQIKTKKYSPKEIDSFFIKIYNTSNKKKPTKKEEIFKIIKILKHLIQINDKRLINKFIRKIRRHHVTNLLCVFNICKKNSKAPLKLLKTILFNHVFNNIKVIKD
jgi:hypothetical protein